MVGLAAACCCLLLAAACCLLLLAAGCEQAVQAKGELLNLNLISRGKLAYTMRAT
jgi:hypothetical protein